MALLQLLRIQTLNYLFKDAASWMMDIPTYRWNSKCYFCSDQLFCQVNGNACVFLWVHVIAKVGAEESESKPAISRRANTDSIFSWTVKNKMCQSKVLKTLPSSAIIWGNINWGGVEMGWRGGEASTLAESLRDCSSHVLWFSGINVRDRSLKQTPF